LTTNVSGDSSYARRAGLLGAICDSVGGPDRFGIDAGRKLSDIRDDAPLGYCHRFRFVALQMRRRPVLAALAYAPVMLGMLLYFTLWFVAYFFGATI
jgi:hypothetical protein